MHRAKWTAVWAAVAAIGLIGCRGKALWSGVEFDGDGLSLVAEQPVCGCLWLKNNTDQALYLRSDLNGTVRGAAVLNPHETRRFRFDWAGTRPDDMYRILGFDPTGHTLNLRKRVDMEAGSSACDAETCLYDTLRMNRAGEEF
ncbi:MAG: hypothetical protein ABJA98_26020 [Acidobacteriota bacterium]